uniref:Uncharacterized protein n=1 Tax=Panagrolaimus davidi TaxID=227884 RepID=A0A914QEI5_9BILA
MNRFQALLPSLHQASRNSLRLYATQTAQEIAEIKGLAYNEVERKTGLYKPEHTLEEQVNYMKSQGMSCMAECLSQCLQRPSNS